MLYLDYEFVFVTSAFKHNFTEEDILHAYKTMNSTIEQIK